MESKSITVPTHNRRVRGMTVRQSNGELSRFPVNMPAESVTIDMDDEKLLEQEAQAVIEGIANPRFREDIDRFVKDEKQNGNFFSQEPQNGKTMIMSILAWLITYRIGGQIVVILDNSREDVKQFLSRIAAFNRKRHPDFRLDFLEIKGKNKPSRDKLDTAIRHNRPILLTTKIERYGRIDEVIKAIDHVQKDINRLVHIIYDEADMSVGSVKADPTTEKERIYRSLPHSRCRFVYITATPIAIWGSWERSNNLSLFEIPDDLYEGLEYRNFFHDKNDIQLLEGLEYLSRKDKEPLEWDRAWERFIGCLNGIVKRRVLHHQPNICLINVSPENDPKDYIARRCIEHYQDRVVFATYTDKGVTTYRANRRPERKAIHIGAYLQGLKDHRETRPIFIMATHKACRSQTFKSDDHRWRLTHFILHLADGATHETTIQSWRCNGQYRPEDDGITIYCTSETYHKCLMVATNATSSNGQMSRLVTSGRSPWDALPDMYFYNTGFKLTRPGCQDFTLPHITDCRVRSIEEAEVWASLLKEDVYRFRGIEVSIEKPTSYHEIPFPNPNPFIVNRTADEPFKGMDTGRQNRLGDYILGGLRRRGLFDSKRKDSCQICYREKRFDQLNGYLGDKHKTHKAFVVALDPKRIDCIPVVIYKPDPPDKGSNKIVIWHTTDGWYRYRYLEKPKKEKKEKKEKKKEEKKKEEKSKIPRLCKPEWKNGRHKG